MKTTNDIRQARLFVTMDAAEYAIKELDIDGACYPVILDGIGTTALLFVSDGCYLAQPTMKELVRAMGQRL